MELIAVACSQHANHLLTHLYNNQESHLPYSKDAKVCYHNRVFLSQNKIGAKLNYTPRALVYDVRNGYGALGQYEYVNPQNQHMDATGTVVSTDTPMFKNEYQKGLDQGVKKSHLLSAENTTFWTDYNKLIYKPQNLHSLRLWEQRGDEIVNRYTPQVKFSGFHVGQEEFKQYEEDTLDHFRRLLEESDYFDGMQLFTESDSAWSGFTNELLVTIKDEFFNYTSNNKFNIWLWDLMGNSNKSPQVLTRIRSFVEASRNASLVLPLKMHQFSSNWENTAVLSVAVNSMWEIINSDPRVSSMKDIETGLLGNDFSRNIVNCISINQLADIDMNRLSLYGLDVDKIELGFNKNSQHEFGSHYIVNKSDKDLFEATNHPKRVYYSENPLLDITNVDTFPDVISYTKAYTKYSIDASLKYDLKKYIEVVKRTRASELILGDKDELLQDLYNLKRAYSSSPEFEDDSDEDDD